MIYVEKVKVENLCFIGVKVELPNSPPLLLIIAENGFVMCGYLNVEVAEKLQVAAATVSGVKTFEDVLEAEVKAATSNAKKFGVNVGMKGKEALMKLA